MTKQALTALILALTASCAGIQRPEPLLVPVPTNCVTGQLPAEPERVQGQLTGDSGVDIAIIAGSAISLRAWGVALRGLLVACQGTQPPITPQP